MQFRKRHGIAFLSLAFLLPVAHAGATTLTWSSYTTWTQNVTGSTELNMGLINTASGTYNTSAGKTLTPMSGPALPFVFTGPDGSGFQLTGGTYGRGNAASLFGASDGVGNITVTLPTGGENAILLGLGTTGNAPSMTVTLSDSETFTVTATSGAYEFLGISLSHDISWLTISSSSQTVVNDFYFGSSKLTQDAPGSQTPSVSPEGSTFSLLGGSLLLFLGLRRKFIPLSIAS